VIRETDHALDRDEGDSWERGSTTFDTDYYLGKAASTYGAGGLFAARTIRLVETKPGWRYLDKGEIGKLKSDWHLHTDKPSKWNEEVPLCNENTFARKIEGDLNIFDYDGSSVPGTADTFKTNDFAPVGASVCIECTTPVTVLSRCKTVDGRDVCGGCWESRTRLERVLKGWESDPYSPVEHISFTDQKCWIGSVEMLPQAASELAIPTPVTVQMDSTYSLDPEDCI